VTPTPTPPSGSANVFGAQTNVTITPNPLLPGQSGTTQVNQQIVTYLSQQVNFTNTTSVYAEIQFWNGVSSILGQKMDYTNPTVATFANAHVIPNDTGSYNVTQISDVWNYVEPLSVENYNYTQEEVDNGIVTNNPTLWTEGIQSADQYLANNLTGVCSDYAIFMASTNLALGGNSRLIYSAIPTSSPIDGGEAHMYAEAEFKDTSFIPIIQYKYSLKNTTTINYHSANITTDYPPPGNWLTLDWFNYPNAATYPGGNFVPNSGYLVFIYKNGDWEMVSTTTSPWQVILHGGP
jgi:hypothetical protein